MSFEWPVALVALGILPLLLVLYALSERRRRKSQAAFGNPDSSTQRHRPRSRQVAPASARDPPRRARRHDRRRCAPARDRERPAGGGDGRHRHGRLALDEGDRHGADPARSGPDAARRRFSRGTGEVSGRGRRILDACGGRRPPDPGPRARRDRARLSTPGEGTAVGDAVSSQSRSASPSRSPAARRRRGRSVISDGLRDGGRMEPARPQRGGPQPRDPGPHGARGHAERRGRGAAHGRLRRRIRVPAAAGDAPALLAAGPAASSSSRSTRESRGWSTRSSAPASASGRSGARSPTFRGRLGSAAPRRRRALGVPLPEGAVKRARDPRACAAPLAAALALTVDRGRGRTSATGSRCACRSPGRGSWCPPPAGRLVRRPAGSSRARSGYVVGGTGRRAQPPRDRRSFLGMLGSPVNPGSRRVAAYLRRDVGRATRGPSSFKPFIGCMPAAGGGSAHPDLGERVPARRAGDAPRPRTCAFARGAPPSRAGCRAGERLVGAGHAFGFHTRTPPSDSLASGVTGTRTVRGGQVVVRVRGDAELEGVRAVVQVQALCARVHELPESLVPRQPAVPRRCRRRCGWSPSAAGCATRCGSRTSTSSLALPPGAIVAAARSRPRCSGSRSASSSRWRGRTSSGMVPKERATVILVVDTSRSMQARDVEPTRLGAAQQAIDTFLEDVPDNLNIGLVVFAGEAQVATPPTKDHDLVRTSMEQIDSFLIFGGTAIGDALEPRCSSASRSTEEEPPEDGRSPLPAARQFISATQSESCGDERPPASILFLSDGAQTRGILEPLEGAALAQTACIPVYTIALGTPEGSIPRGSFGGFGTPGSGGSDRIPVPPDPETLRQIAEVYRRRVLGGAGRRLAREGVLEPRLPARPRARRDRGHVHLPRPRRRASCPLRVCSRRSSRRGSHKGARPESASADSGRAEIPEGVRRGGGVAGPALHRDDRNGRSAGSRIPGG